MGRSVVCKCGQRNDLAVFAAGEVRLCLACGSSLSGADTPLLEESFVPEVPPGTFPEDPGSAGDFAPLNSFESPSDIDIPAAPEAPAQAAPRVWTSGLRELSVDESLGQCTRCRRTFRGSWDMNATSSGTICHLCAIQAQKDHTEPTTAEQRELYRPTPPKPIVTTEVGAVGTDPERKRIFRGLITLALVGMATVGAVAFLPVEHWVADFLATDYTKATELPLAVVWGVRIIMFFVRAFAQTVALYVTLSMLNMLTDDERQERLTLIYLGVAFALINTVADFAISLYAVIPIVGPIFVGLVIFVQLSMAVSHFNIYFESGCAFFMTWILMSMILWPCMYMVSQFIGGILAGILL